MSTDATECTPGSRGARPGVAGKWAARDGGRPGLAGLARG
jgi:hypothetical protein